MPTATALLQTSESSIRALFESAFRQLQEQSGDAGKAELSETGQAMEQALLVLDSSSAAENVLARNNINQIRGIIATRSHDPEIMQQAYSDLVQNISNDARQFFNKGRKQMEIVDYPEHVKEIMQQYNDLWGSEDALH